MATNGRFLVVGVFTDDYEAERGIDALQGAGFAGDQIYFMGHSGGTTEGNISKDDLVKMGISKEDANYYQNEFEVGRTIVVVGATDRYDQAIGVLRENGAYDVKTHQGA